jgi:hypothetical protein
MTRVEPGYAFALVTDIGFAVGLTTHVLPRHGTLVWFAERVFDAEPTMAEVRALEQWRWPVFFAVEAAVRRRLVQPVGIVVIPSPLRRLPRFRGGARGMGWVSVKYDKEGRSRRPAIRRAPKPTDPISQAVNVTALKEMIITGWRPEQDW